MSSTSAQRSVRLRRGGGRARHRHRPTAMGLNLAPMIDMTFLLLIFFLVTSTFERAEGILASALPQGTGAAASVELPLTPIVIRLHRTGPGKSDVSVAIDRFPDVPQDFNGLAGYLLQVRQQPGFDEKTPVILWAQDDVAWDHVVAAWNAAVRAGFARLAFGQEANP